MSTVTFSSTGPIDRATKDIVRGIELWRIWVRLAYQDIIAKYRRTLLGPFWVAGSTVATSIAIALVYGGLFGLSVKESLPSIAAGILTWTFMVGIVFDAPNILLGASGTILTLPLPITLHFWRFLLRQIFVALHNIIAFIVVMLCVGLGFTIRPEFIPGFMLVSMICIVWALPLGILALRYRDVMFLLGYLAQILFFLTPVFWKPEKLTGKRALFVEFNPFYYMLNLMRNPLLGGAPSAHDWLVGFGLLFTGMAVGFVAFVLYRRRIVFWL